MTWDLGLETWNLGLGTWDLDHMSWDLELGTWDLGREAWDCGSWILGLEFAILGAPEKWCLQYKSPWFMCIFL